MERIKYPILNFNFEEGFSLGILIGTDYQVVEKDTKKVKSSLLSYIQKQYKKYDDYPIMDIQEPRLKMVEVNIRPAYIDNSGTYPMSYTVDVPIPVVYGETDQGHFECFLPLFEQSFYYYDADQFEALVQHFTTNLLNQEGPDKIYKLIQYPTPTIEFIHLRVNHDREFDWSGLPSQRQYRVLNRLAEQYPLSRSLKKNRNSPPEVAWELDEKVNEVFDKLINTRSNILVVGNHGVGKSAVLQQAIRKITSQKKTFQFDYTFWRIMAQRITSSTKYLGEWQEATEALIDELNVANGMLWVIDFPRLFQTGGHGPEDSVASFFSAYLQQGKLQLIGEATPEELESMRRMLPGFIEHFQIIQIAPPTTEQVHSILNRFTNFVAQKHKIEIDTEAIQLTFRLLSRYFTYESFPGKAIKFLGQCLNKAQLAGETHIDKSAVLSNFIDQTGLPELFLRDDLLLNQKELFQFFNQRIIGQPLAVNKLCSLVKVYKAGLNNPNKPISTMLFAGPTGVGKTASAKALSNYFFGKGQKKSPLIRIDMSEFQHPSQIYRFIGAGGEVGQLVKEIRERSFAVLLLDEIEKAHPSIFDVLLGVLDEGKLVDGFGRITDFRNTIIILTSNLGASAKQPLGFQSNQNQEMLFLSAIQKHFRPEFVNRIDSIVLFKPLDQEDIHKITLKELNALKKREGFIKKKLELNFSESIIKQITRIGFDQRYGARPLQRAIEQTLVTPMANWLLENPSVTNTTITINYDGDVKIVPDN